MRLLPLGALAVFGLLIAAPAFAGASVKVPEPASIGLLAAGIGALAVARTFRKRK